MMPQFSVATSRASYTTDKQHNNYIEALNYEQPVTVQASNNNLTENERHYRIVFVRPSETDCKASTLQMWGVHIWQPHIAPIVLSNAQLLFFVIVICQ